MLINGIELNIDVTDLEFVEKYENGHNILTKELSELEKKYDNQSTVEILKNKIKIFNEALIRIIGEKAVDKCIKKKTSLKEYIDLYLETENAIVSEYKKINAETDNAMNKLVKYSLK